MQGNTQAFIVRIWYEETGGEGGALVRRGSIEHVSSKRRLYFQDQAAILKFIDEQVGVATQVVSNRAEDLSHLAGSR